MMEDVESKVEPILDQIVRSTDIVSFNQLCRVCASSKDHVIGLYSEESKSNGLADKLNRYLPVEVSENDSLPQQCCWNCASAVLAWHELYLLSAQSEGRLRELQRELQDMVAIKEPLNEDFASDLGDDGLSEIAEDVVEVSNRLKPKAPAASVAVFCQETSLTTLSCNDVSEKTEEAWNSPSNSIAHDPLQSYIDDVANVDHFVLKKIEPKLNDANPDNKEEAFNFNSDYNNFEDESIFKEERVEVDLDLSSDSCQQETKEKKTSELKKPQKNNKLNMSMINSAKVVVEGRVYYNCKICGKSLHSPYTFMWHTRIHTGEKPFICDLCGKQFRVSQGLVRHLRETHEGIKNYGCDICGRMFASRRNVEEHRRIHTNERPYICDLCGKSFKQKASLFVHKRSHKNTFPFRCSYCSQGFRTRPPLLIHVMRHTGEKPHPCDVCGRHFRIKYELKRHQLIHSEEKPFSCDECGLSFKQKRYLRNHNKVNHNSALTEEDISTITFIENHDMDENHQLTAHDTITRSEITFNETRQSTISKKRKRTRKEITYSIFCEVCNLGYTRFADMLKHKRLKHPMVLEEPELKNENDCELCSKKYKSTLELKRHLREIHRQSIPRRRRRQEDIVAEHFCEVCDKGFTRKFDMQKHHAQKHPEQSLKDAVEPSKRKKSSELLKKCKVINEEGVITHYKCETCQKSFKQSYNFIRHQSVHTGIKAYVCHKCGKEFRVSSGLVRHIKQYHQRIRKYGCDVCGKMFAAKSSWKNHSRVHTGDRPFICEVCGKSFKQQATLHSHKLFHTNNFKYSCNFCGKKFRRSGDLKVHVWVHTGHKPYNCDMCSAAFRLPQDLKKHKVIHKRIDGYKCIKCGACFPQERFLKSHLLNQHYENKSTKNTIISNILI